LFKKKQGRRREKKRTIRSKQMTAIDYKLSAFRQPLPFGHPAALLTQGAQLHFTCKLSSWGEGSATSDITRTIILQQGNVIPQSLSSM
jgi:hypothetical protein